MNGREEKAEAVLFDFDCTLVDTRLVQPLRTKGNWNKILEQENLDKCILYQGISDVLASIKKSGRKIGIVTNSPKHICEGILKAKGLLQYIDHITGYRDTQNHKPDPEPVNHALLKLKVNPKNAILVGDRAEDIKAGRAANCHAVVGALWGSSEVPAVRATKPDFLLEEVSDFYKQDMFKGNVDMEASAAAEKVVQEEGSQPDQQPQKPKRKRSKNNADSTTGILSGLGGIPQPADNFAPKADIVAAPKACDGDSNESGEEKQVEQPLTIFQDIEVDNELRREAAFLGLTWYLMGFWELRNTGESIRLKDAWSSKFIDEGLKKGENSKFVLDFISEILSKIVKPGLTIAAVPSSKTDADRKELGKQEDTMVVRLARELANKSQGIEAAKALVRNTSVSSSRGSNFRVRADIDHVSTIDFDPTYLNKVQGKPVLLLDDVFTTGKIFTVCQKKLQDAGAGQVVCLAIARTIPNPFFENIYHSPAQVKLMSGLPGFIDQVALGKDLGYSAEAEKTPNELIADNFSNAEKVHNKHKYKSPFFLDSLNKAAASLASPDKKASVNSGKKP